MILHIPAAGGGKPILISIPRDSYVNIPGHGMNKINAAFSFGGPALLATDSPERHRAVHQPLHGHRLRRIRQRRERGRRRPDVRHPRRCTTRLLAWTCKQGCQVLSGGEALAYVRDRHSFATQDLQREQDQRIFLKALLTKMTSPGVMLNPFAALPAASGAAGNLTVDQGTSLYQLVEAAMALRESADDHGADRQLELRDCGWGRGLWNSTQAKELFTALQDGQPVPESLITGSRTAPDPPGGPPGLVAPYTRPASDTGLIRI